MFKEAHTKECDGVLATLHRPHFMEAGEFPSRVIVISPHTDDAAFSLAATLKVLVSAGSSVRIVNCFTLSRFAPFKAEGSKISAITRRRHEEELFLHTLGGNSQSDDLGLPDAPARTGVGLRGILANHLSPKQISEAVNMLVESLEAPGDDTAIIAPLGIGNHSDHYIALRAALVKYRNHPIAFYEDLPYAAATNESQIETAVKHVADLAEEELQPLLFQWPGDAEWKRQCCSHYKSQVSDAGIQKMLDYMERNFGERLWCSPRFINGWEWQLSQQVSVALEEPYFL